MRSEDSDNQWEIVVSTAFNLKYLQLGDSLFCTMVETYGYEKCYAINDVTINYVVRYVMYDDVINNFDQEWKHTCVNTSQKCRYNKAQSDWLQTTDQWDLVWTFFIYSKFNKSGVVSLGDKLFRGAGVGAVPAGPIRGVGAIFVGGFVVGTDGAFRRTFAMSAKFSSLALENKVKNQNSKKSFFLTWTDLNL